MARDIYSIQSVLLNVSARRVLLEAKSRIPRPRSREDVSLEHRTDPIIRMQVPVAGRKVRDDAKSMPTRTRRKGKPKA